MNNKPSYSGYHSPKARYNRSRKMMSEKELKRHDTHVSRINWIVAIVIIVATLIVVALGGTIK